MDRMLAKANCNSYCPLMSDTSTRKFIRTKFEGVFYRLSAKRDLKTGEPDKVYCFRYVDLKGREHWKTVGRHSDGIRATTARKARSNFLLEMENSGVNPEERNKVTIGQVVDAYVEWARAEGRDIGTFYHSYHAHMEDIFSELPISNLNANIVTQCKSKMLKSPVVHYNPKRKRIDPQSKSKKLLAPATINKAFAFLRSAVNRAISNGLWNGVNPFSKAAGYWKPIKENNKRLRFLTKEEAKALLADLEVRNPSLHDMVLLSLKTGLRPTEMFRLKGQDIDTNSSTLYIIAKGGRRMPVRVPDDMIEMLVRYHRKPHEYVFQKNEAHAPFTKTPGSLRNAVRALHMEPEDGDPLYTITLHTMRHTFASWLAQSGEVSLMELQKLMRHANINMTMRYAHLMPGQESEKLSIINRFLD